MNRYKTRVNRTTMILGMAIMLLFSVVGVQPAMGQPRESVRGGHERLREELRLSPEQVELLRQLRRKHRQSTEPLLRELQTLRQKLVQNYQNSKETEKMANRIGELHRLLSLQTRQHLIEISGVLSESQMKRFTELRIQRECRSFPPE